MGRDEMHEWHGYASADSLLPLCRYCNPRWEDKDETALDPEYDIDPPIDRATAINYELAGREDASYSFKDFRSPSKARTRHRERNEKYYSWRGVKPGQLNRAHYTLDGKYSCWYTRPLPEAPVSMMTKQQLYYEAQMYPRPPRYHRSKPWEKGPWGAAHRDSGPKHARQRLVDDVEDALDFASLRHLVKHGTPGFDWTASAFGEEAMFAACTANEIGSIEAEECGCACNLCHRECHEQQRREGEAEVAMLDAGSESGDEGWHILSNPSTSAAESEDEWHAVDAGSEMDEDGWSSLTNPFTSGEDFGADGYLPYTDAHFFCDLSIGRCRACIADYIVRIRLHYCDQTRLSDIAFLRGMPVEYTTRTRKAGVPFRQLLPILAEIETGAERPHAREVVRSARGPLAEDYYQLLAPSWWNRRDVKTNPEARVTDDVVWMLKYGCE